MHMKQYIGSLRCAAVYAVAAECLRIGDYIIAIDTRRNLPTARTHGDSMIRLADWYAKRFRPESFSILLKNKHESN
jgi:hypothetical protein